MKKTLRKKTIDWIKIKSLYFGGTAPSELSKKFRVKVNTIHSRIEREGWAKERTKMHQAVGKNAQKVAEETLIRLSDESDENLLYLRSIRPKGKKAGAVSAAAWMKAWDLAWRKKLRAIGLPEKIIQNENNNRDVPAGALGELEFFYRNAGKRKTLETDP